MVAYPDRTAFLGDYVRIDGNPLTTREKEGPAPQFARISR
jgi:hypothetical protein